MEWLYPLLQAVQVISALTVIGLVLLQHGRGADMGSAFGAGSAGSVFGAAGAANFLSKTTRWAAIVFFVATAGLAWAVYHPKQKVEESGSVMQGFESVVPGAPGQIGGQENTESQHDASVPTVPGASGGSQNQQSSDLSVPSVPSVESTKPGGEEETEGAAGSSANKESGTDKDK